MPRVFAASRTLTVPPMFTAVPYGGSGLIWRHEQRGEMDHVRDPVLVEQARERLAVDDVALHERDLGVGDEPQAAVVGAEVEADDVDALLGQQRARPRADAAERAGDEEPLALTGST